MKLKDIFCNFNKFIRKKILIALKNNLKDIS